MNREGETQGCGKCKKYLEMLNNYSLNNFQASLLKTKDW